MRTKNPSYKKGNGYCRTVTANKKGFGAGKAWVGAVAVGPLGLLAGGIGSGNVEVTCLKCGNKFKPGKK